MNSINKYSYDTGQVRYVYEKNSDLEYQLIKNKLLLKLKNLSFFGIKRKSNKKIKK